MSIDRSPLARNLPHPGAYARLWKQLKCTRQDVPQHAGRLWEVYGTAAEHLRLFDEALQRRINLRGGLPAAPISPEHETRLRRDQRMLHDYLQRRIVHSGSGFETELCRRRFPAVHARMRERCDD